MTHTQNPIEMNRSLSGSFFQDIPLIKLRSKTFIGIILSVIKPQRESAGFNGACTQRPTVHQFYTYAWNKVKLNNLYAFISKICIAGESAVSC